MPKQAKLRLPLFDFATPLIVKLPVAFMSEFVPVAVILAVIFYGLRWLGLATTSVYVGKAAFALIFGFCLFAALQFNSIRSVRRLCATRKTNPMFIIPHPVVEDLRKADSPVTKAEKYCAIAFIETKAYTIAYGAMFILLYFGLLYFLFYYNPSSFTCRGSCEVFRFGVKPSARALSSISSIRFTSSSQTSPPVPPISSPPALLGSWFS